MEKDRLSAAHTWVSLHLKSTMCFKPTLINLRTINTCSHTFELGVVILFHIYLRANMQSNKHTYTYPQLDTYLWMHSNTHLETYTYAWMHSNIILHARTYSFSAFALNGWNRTPPSLLSRRQDALQDNELCHFNPSASELRAHLTGKGTDVHCIMGTLGENSAILREENWRISSFIQNTDSSE